MKNIFGTNLEATEVLKFFTELLPVSGLRTGWEVRKVSILIPFYIHREALRAAN